MDKYTKLNKVWNNISDPYDETLGESN